MCEGFSKNSSNKNKKYNIDKHMPSELIREVVKEGIEMRELKEIIPSTMGEPLLYKDFDVFIELCNKYNIKLNLTTNGTFPRKGIIEWSKSLLPICSDIKISWNGFTKKIDEAIMQGRKFEKATRNLKDLLEIRKELITDGIVCSSITLQLTFLEMNYQEIPDIVKMAIELGIDRVKGHHLWIHNPYTEKWSMRRDKQSLENWNKIAIKTIDLNNSFKKEKRIKLENIYPILEEKILLKNSVCPFLGREAWISATGSFSPCCAPDDLRRELGDFGNLNEIKLKEIWTNKGYNALCTNYNQFTLCQSCNMRKKPQDVYKFGFK